MKGLFFCVSLLSLFKLHASFTEIETLEELHDTLKTKKECILAIGMKPCIPCDKLKKRLIENQKELPEVFWIDLKKLPKIRHVFPFKAVPFMAIYQDGDLVVNMTGEQNCRDYLINTRYLEQK